MNKELKAFRKICKNINSYGLTYECSQNKKLIETTLKDHETLKKEYEFLSEHFNELLNESRKEHRIIEIIKKKKVNVLELSVCGNYETYMSFFKKWNWNGEYDNFILTPEEYDLLREVLL